MHRVKASFWSFKVVDISTGNQTAVWSHRIRRHFCNIYIYIHNYIFNTPSNSCDLLNFWKIAHVSCWSSLYIKKNIHPNNNPQQPLPLKPLGFPQTSNECPRRWSHAPWRGPFDAPIWAPMRRLRPREWGKRSTCRGSHPESKISPPGPPGRWAVGCFTVSVYERISWIFWGWKGKFGVSSQDMWAKSLTEATWRIAIQSHDGDDSHGTGMGIT